MCSSDLAAPNQIETGGVVVNSGQNRTVVLAGDSQASMYGTALADLAREMGFTLYVLSMDGRNELPEEPGTYWPAVASFIIQRQPDVVVMAIYGQTSSVTIPGRCKPHCRTSTDVQSASYC